MSILLFVVGAVALAAGAAMVGFGIPINEFSFGNTLIVSGTMAVIGGLIVLALGVAVLYLQRIAEALALRPGARPGRPSDAFESNGRMAANPARIPFPPKKTVGPKPEAVVREPVLDEPRMDAPVPADITPRDRVPEFMAPTLPNPDEPPVTVEDDVSLSPQQSAAQVAHPPAEPEGYVERRLPPFFRSNEAEADAGHVEPPAFDADWRSEPRPPVVAPRKPPTTYFDSMWPSGPKSQEPAPSADDTAEERPADHPPAAEAPPASPFAPPRAASSPEPVHDEPAAVAILKSGVVDGMGYTLYVDGSIEAELPQGTLRFASINELRRHLEKTA